MGAMSESKARGPDDLSAKELLLYLGILAIAIVGIVLGAPVWMMSGLGGGSIAMIYSYLKAQKSSDSK